MSKYTDYVPQPLAFYRELSTGDRQYQNYNLGQCAGDLSTWRFVVVAQMTGAPIDNPRLRIPPFQIKRATALGAAVTTFKLISVDGLLSDTTLALTGFSVEDLNDTPTRDAIIYDGSTLTPDIAMFLPGRYYLTVSDGTNTWYSEVFELESEDSENLTFPSTCSDLPWISLEYSNSGCIISETIHNNAPSFRFLIPASLGQPAYDYKPETKDNGQGGTVKLFHRLEKRWQFFILAPEYVADALAAVQMMSSVTINFVSGDFIICNDVEVDVAWETACLAKITFTFTADILSKTSCCG